MSSLPTSVSSPFVLLPSSHARSRDVFSAEAELELALRSGVRGEVRFDPAAKALYATDASNYRHIPIGLVIPLDEEDTVVAVRVCREFGAAVLPRGAGTSLAGQACNAAVVLDFSKYMHGMSAVDPISRTVYVQPGIVLDRVREAAEVHALTFAPDPATHSRCTIGGMIGNNSCGVHGLMGGKTVDNVESLDLLLYDGTRMRVGKTSEVELADKLAEGGRVGAIYRALRSLGDRSAEEVRRRFPPIPRRVSGFNLDELLPENGFHLARALVGSEGTCAIVLGATLKLTASPQFRTLVGLGFEDIFLAADHVPQILRHRPIGLEGFDSLLLEALRRKGKSLGDIELLPDGRGFLLAEFGGRDQGEAEAQAEALVRELSAFGAIAARLYTPEEATRVWFIRESGLGATAFVPGKGTGWEGWEDAAVEPARLGSYLRAIYALMQEFGYQSPMYGHFGQGCVHMRHNFDLESERGILSFRRFMDEAVEVALAHGGSLSGEHGDGQARGALLPRMFGAEMMDYFREFKQIWDPENRLNPNNLIDPHQPHEDLRLGADYEPWRPETHFAFAEDHGSLASATLRCVGVGACRKQDAGTMCPSFMATGEEMHSTRGRAHLLWELMQGEVLEGGWKNAQVKESLDLCLSCKACKSECPVSVDMATYKAEFLSHYYDGERRPLSHYAFGYIDKWSRLASLLPEVANAAGQVKLFSGLTKRLLHIHPSRTLPRFHTSFVRRRREGANSAGRKVLLWADTFNNYMHPGTLAAADAVLKTAGFRVTVPKRHLCCGRPLYDFGLLDSAREYLVRVLDALGPELEAGTPVVVLEPSCASVFRDELPNLLSRDPRACRLKAQTFLLSEFLVEFAPEYVPSAVTGRVIVHGHCHHRAGPGMRDEMALLRSTGAEVELLDSGCCGMAGPFGFESGKYDLSQKLAERVLLPAVRRAQGAAIIVTDGFSCREQIAQNTGVRAFHLAEVLAGTGVKAMAIEERSKG